ncbi:DNA cytosine methyltransferase [Aliarcobacter butzleri]|uniref:DNA cytosine methyltransferase n=1 Tax=Aliarcobacter butzleri TaxID=28197 RepID=UPI0021B46C25|nr:DNA cytosine methyltransferase [Aliarcobacter butzleri]MCT7563348.1 DNA cytosine methyltransferase [Aliarcobacter butzleri]
MSYNNLIKSYFSKIGERNGTKRIWIESKKLHETELAQNLRYEPEYDFEAKRITLKAGFTNKISIREKSNSLVIDILNQNVNEIFKGFQYVVIKLYNDEVIIEPLKEEKDQQIAKQKAYSKTPTAIEIFAGGGTLVKALSDAGIKTIAAVELEDKYLQNLESNNPNVTTYCGDLAKLDILMLPNADMVVAGIPCEGYSQSQTKSEKFEAHPTGSLGFYVLKIIDAIRPAVVLIEEVPNFKNSAMATMTRYVLTSMGYHINETELVGSDYGSLTKRKRYCMVASIKKGFEFNDSYKKINIRTVKDILEVPIEERIWLDKNNSSTISYSIEKEKEHIRKGEGFRIGRTYVTDTITPTITKGYYKNRLTDPILCHPTIPDTYSWFTPRELARINGLPEDFILTETKSTNGEIIGQGVCYEVFNSIGKMIVQHFNSEEFDIEKHKLDLFKSTIESTNNIDYSDEQLSCFMSGSLF